MTTTAQLFDQLNRFRVRNNKKPLKSWKESRQKLIDALNKETNFEASLEEIQKQQPRQEIKQSKEHVIEATPHEHVIPSKERQAELKQARLENERKNKKLEEMEKESPSPSAKETSREKLLKGKKIGVKRPAKEPQRSTRTFSAAQIIMDFGIDPKQGRALLRKHNIAKTPEAIRKFFQERKK